MLTAPFPWFGGKSRVAHIVWERFGDVGNYTEPFFGSGAVLLGRPHEPRTETVNDKDAYLANFWRAIKHDPEAVAEWADWPVSECDLQARHLWLVNQEEFVERMKTDPDFYDVKIAGWWVWGICCWIGSGWCKAISRQLPHLGNAGVGVHRRLPALGFGRGVNRKRPQLTRAFGVQAERCGDLKAYFTELSNRFRRVRVCCGDWKRILGPTPTEKLGITGVFLDPPYSAERDNVYNHDSYTLSHEVRDWALAHGDNPKLRIALCGYEGEHDLPWEKVAWKAHGGYANLGNNRGKERIWFSPHCLMPQDLFKCLRDTSLPAGLPGGQGGGDG